MTIPEGNYMKRQHKHLSGAEMKWAVVIWYGRYSLCHVSMQVIKLDSESVGDLFIFDSVDGLDLFHSPTTSKQTHKQLFWLFIPHCYIL